MLKSPFNQMCIHLKPLEDYLIGLGIAETYRGQVWSENCREWVYYDAVLQPERLKKRFNFDDTITVFDYVDIKVGSELGLECSVCKDGIMGPHPTSLYAKGKPVIN